MTRKFTKYPSNYVKASITNDERMQVIDKTKQLIRKTYKELLRFDQPESYIAQPYKGPGSFGYGIGNNLELCDGKEGCSYKEGCYYTTWSLTVGGAYDKYPEAQEIIHKLVKYLSDNENIIWDWNNPNKQDPDYQHYKPIFNTGHAWSEYGIMLMDYSRKLRY